MTVEIRMALSPEAAPTCCTPMRNISIHWLALLTGPNMFLIYYPSNQKEMRRQERKELDREGGRGGGEG